IALGLHRVDDFGLAAVPAQHAGVARLAAACGIEDRTVQPQATLFERGHGGFGFLEIGVLTEQFLDHKRGFRPSAVASQLPLAAAGTGSHRAARRNRPLLHWHIAPPREGWRLERAVPPRRRRSNRRRRSCRPPWP